MEKKIVEAFKPRLDFQTCPLFSCNELSLNEFNSPNKFFHLTTFESWSLDINLNLSSQSDSPKKAVKPK